VCNRKIQWPTIPVWWQKKGYCCDMPNVVSAIDGTTETFDRKGARSSGWGSCKFNYYTTTTAQVQLSWKVIVLLILMEFMIITVYKLSFHMCLFQLLTEFQIQHGSTYRKCVIVKFSGQPSQSGGKRKGIVLICLTLCLQLTGERREQFRMR
jgi:hypothetical protein